MKLGLDLIGTQGPFSKDSFETNSIKRVCSSCEPLHLSSFCFSPLLCIHLSQSVRWDVPHSGRIMLLNWLQLFASSLGSMEVSLNKWIANVSSNANPISDGGNYFHTISTSIFKLWGTTDWFGHHSQTPVIKIRRGHLIQRHGVWAVGLQAWCVADIKFQTYHSSHVVPPSGSGLTPHK